jgi:hypothetical protein
MKVLRLANGSANPLAREEELLIALEAAGACSCHLLRLTISGRRLFLDGFVESLDQKLRAEQACRELAPESTVVNRLRVGCS